MQQQQLNLLGDSYANVPKSKAPPPPVPTKIRDLLDKQGIPLVDAADSLSLNKGNLSGYASGELAIPTRLVHRLCAFFACTPNDLYGIDGSNLGLPKSLSIGLWKAIRYGGKVNSDVMIAFADAVEQMAGRKNPIEQWIRRMSVASREVEAWNLGTDKAKEG